ncbi:MAG: P-loop NTPase fold protein [Kiloniellales bacterium]
MTQKPTEEASQKATPFDFEFGGLSAKQRFLELVNNQAKFEKASSSAARDSGFVCLVRAEGQDTPSLRGLQDLCHGEEQRWNQCYSLRYRIEAPSGFGTLAFALLWDLFSMMDDPIAWDRVFGTPGPLEPDPADSALPNWDRFAEKLRSSGLRSLVEEMPKGQGFVLREEWLDAIWKIFAGDDVIQTGQRFLVFCEFEGTAEPDQWDALLAYLDGRLPERFGFVFSGLPDDLSFEIDGVATEVIGFAADDPLVRQESGEPTAQLFQISGLSSDRPAGQDDLGVQRYAESLAKFILHPDTRPLTIGIHGPWGKGKTSFMGFIEQDLVREVCAGSDSGTLADLQSKEQRLADNRMELEQAQDALRRLPGNGAPADEAAERARVRDLQRARERALAEREAAWKAVVKRSEEGVVCVNFNAWRFEDSQQIWAGLASVIVDRFEASLTTREKLRMRLIYIWRARRTEAWRALIEVGLAAVLGLVLLLTLGESELLTFTGQDAVSKVLLVLAGPVSVFLLVAWRLRGLIRPLGQRVMEYAQLPDYREQRGFQHKVLDDIRAVADTLRQFKRAEPKIVIFIDDLDRCSDDKIMEILQAINLVLAESRFYVVMGVDTTMLFRAIQAHYRKAHGGQTDPGGFARRYLRKIIQLSFHLPDSADTQRSAFIESLFSAAARGSTADPAREASAQESAGDLPPLEVDLTTLREADPVPLEQVTDTAAELQAFKDFAGFIEDNARETKRLVNVHRLVKILLQEANQGWSQERQRRLVRWLVFCSAWPEMIDEALRHAKKHPDAGDVFAELTEEEPPYRPASWIAAERADLRQFASDPLDAPIAASVLSEDRALFLAAKIAELVQDSGSLASEPDSPEPPSLEPDS